MIYLAGSLKTTRVPLVAKELREAGFEVFDDWYAAGRIADKEWQTYHQARGLSYAETLKCPFPKWAFQFDISHLFQCDAFVATSLGRSACWELGYAYALDKPTFVLLLFQEPQEWDLMLAGATLVYTVPDLVNALKELKLWP